MKKKHNGIISIILCVVMVATLFTACSIKQPEQTEMTTIVPNATWGATPDGAADLPTMLITGANLGELVQGALGEDFKDFNDDNLNSLTPEQQEAVKDYAEDKGYIVEEDEDGKTVIKAPVEDVPEEEINQILTQASVQDPSNLTPEESERVSELLEENSMLVTENDKGEVDYVKPVLTSKPATAPATKPATKPAPPSTDKKGNVIVPTQPPATGNYVPPSAAPIAPMGTTLVRTNLISPGWLTSYAVAASETSPGASGTATTAFAANEVTSDGGVVAVGTSMLPGANGNTGFCAVVVKYDSKGNVSWSDTITANKSTAFDDVTVLSDGSIVAVGYTIASDFDDSIYRCKNTVEAIMVKYTAGGQKVWDNPNLANDRGVKIIGGSGDEEIHAIQATSDGGFIIGGRTTSTDFDFKNSGAAKIKAFTVKCDGNGNIKWQNFLGGAKHSSVEDISINSNGDIFTVTDVRTDTDDYAKYEGAKDGRFSTLIRKLDASGKEKWSQFYYESGNTQLLSVVPTEDGGCVAAGQYSVTKEGNSYSFKDFYNGGNAGTYDGMVVKFGSDGSRKWALPIVGFKTDIITDIVKIPGGYAVSGYTTSTNRDFANLAGAGEYDAFIYAITEHGVLQTMSSFGGSGMDRIYSMASSGGTTIHVCGSSGSPDGIFANVTYKGTPEKQVGFVYEHKLNQG